MAAEKEEIILSVVIDQADGLSELEKTKKAILNNKEAIADLNKAYKEGTISQDAYIKQTIKLQDSIKTENKLFADLNKALKIQDNSLESLRKKTSDLKKERDKLDLTSNVGLATLKKLNTEIDKNDQLIQKNLSLQEKQKINIGNYASALDKVIPGTEKFSSAVTGLTGSLGGTIGAIQKTGFSLQTLNTIPAVALVSSLVAVFDLLKTSADAAADSFLKGFTYIQDQEEAINRLRKATDNYIDRLNAENELLSVIGGRDIDIIKNDEKQNLVQRANQLKKISLIKEEILLIGSRENFYKQFSEGKATDDLIKKQLSLSVVLSESGKTEKEYLESKKQELETEQKILVSLNNQNTVIGAKQVKQREADDEKLKKLREEARLLADIDRRNKGTTFKKTTGDIELDAAIEQGIKKDFGATLIDEQRIEIEIKKDTAAKLKAFTDEYERNRTETHLKEIAIRHQADLTEVQLTAGILGSLQALFKSGGEEYKLLASAQTIISTYAGAVKAYESQASIPYVGPELGAAAAAAAIIEGLANLAVINGVQFAEGGYTGAGGKYEKAGDVHKGEVVWNQTDVALAGGPHAANSMRPTYKGYADGGIVTGSMTSGINSEIAQMNAVKNLPTPEVSVKEITKVQSRIRVKENISTL